jgi:hypothetical protein
MALSDLSEALAAVADRSPRQLILPWPIPGKPGGFISFANFAEWQMFVLRLRLPKDVPQPLSHKFERAQKLYLLAWVDFDLIKTGELAALIALEYAVRDRYAHRSKARRPAKSQKKKINLDAKVETFPFTDLLKFMAEHDGLTDQKIPVIRRCGGTATGFVTGELRPSLADCRNSAAHGDPFDGLPIGGLLELVRDLIEYAYRDWIAEARSARGES